MKLMNISRLALCLVFLTVAMTWTAIAQDAESNQETAEEKTEQDIAVEMVVSASRKLEKKLEAPATIEAISKEDVVMLPGTSFNDSTTTMKGVEYQNAGLNYQRISARGFSTSFNSRMLSMVDGRLATLPGAGTPQGTLVPTPSIDVKSVEVVLGPASALYGANASAGVFNVLTKSPWDEEGLAATLKAGNQSLIDVQLRYAGISDDGRWAWKFTGEYLDGEDYDTDNIYLVNGENQTLYYNDPTLTRPQADAILNQALANGTAYREDSLTDLGVTALKYKVAGYYKQDDWLAALTYGWSENDTITTTNLGRNRLIDWEVEYYQAEVTHTNFYIKWAHTENKGGKTYGIQNVPPFLAAGLPFDSIIADPNRALVFDASAMDDIEAQFNFAAGPFDLIGGVSYREFEPDSGGTYLDDRPDANGVIQTIKRDETGAYLQFDLRVLEDALRFTGGIRYDDSNEYEAQTSPKISVTYNKNNHNFRAGYNEAHRDPSILENHLFFAGGVALGNGRGWTVTDTMGNLVTSYPALAPELVKTFEVGYRGIWGGNLVIDTVAYSSEYENFISALQLIAHALLFGTVAVDADGGVHPVVLTYLNYGQADVDGFDIGVDYFRGKKLHLNFSYGYQKLKSFQNNTPIPDLPFNTPEWKIKGTLSLKDIWLENTLLNLGLRHVDEYEYHSGRWNGVIENSTYVDLTAGYRWVDKDTLFKINVNNLLDEDETELIGVPAMPAPDQLRSLQEVLINNGATASFRGPAFLPEKDPAGGENCRI